MLTFILSWFKLFRIDFSFPKGSLKIHLKRDDIMNKKIIPAILALTLICTVLFSACGKIRLQTFLIQTTFRL